MDYWLFKSEPYKFSWDNQCEKGEGRWEKRVRNYQARNNMQAMKKGDRGFFYHSNEGKEIVGIIEITGESYPDPDDETGAFVTVNVKPVKPLKKPVTLQTLKAHDLLKDMKVVRQVRLSVSPVTEEEWKTVCKLGGI
ncbi:MAG: EVE domain-containing protein [Rhodospirillales bacterium]|nr:EVE domain-containing protein [Alphaproteobacteria bacterium]MCB9976991.1 EVE domain-containing protein [Rhodospirillales bacterium]